MSESLVSTTRRFGIPSAEVLSAVFPRWAELVGPDIAAHARPRSLRKGVLVVEVDDPAWATQLRYLSAELMARVTAAAGPEGIGEIKIRVRGTKTAEARRNGGGQPQADTPL